MCRWTLLVAPLLVAAFVGAPPADAQRDFPEPPERYVGLDAWFEGEIVDIRERGGVLKLKTVEMTTDFQELIAGDPERGAWVELRYAKGWMFFDQEDGSQRRRNLREGRERLRVGQIIAIGREPSQGGGWEGASIRVSGGTTLSSGKQVRLRGWILARVSPFREQD